MKKVTVIYDDSIMPCREVRNITGNKSFGNTIYKRIKLSSRTRTAVVKQGRNCEFILSDELGGNGAIPEGVYFKLFSNMAIKDEKAFKTLLEKASYAKDIYRITQDNEEAAIIYPDAQSLDADTSDSLEIVTDAFLNLNNPAAFRQFITGGFDARFFNALTGDDYRVVKHSEKKEKLKKEFDFYGLLPEKMKMWFVMPFDYRENDTEASYTMERYHMTDLAIRFVHGAISPDEFNSILERLFKFIEERTVKDVSPDEYDLVAQSLYIDKVKERIENLKNMEGYERIASLISSGTGYENIDQIVERYLALYKSVTGSKKFKPLLVVGHGDLGFSNILYSEEASLIRLIDPKGASSEDELYTNPYYDIAKLSHSICGSYDYFNSDQFEISLDEELKLKLTIDCDNAVYKDMFKEYLKKYELDYNLIRLYEASLFLSMLPLHMDREKKVLGFILNAIDIMDELRP